MTAPTLSNQVKSFFRSPSGDGFRALPPADQAAVLANVGLELGAEPQFVATLVAALESDHWDTVSPLLLRPELVERAARTFDGLSAGTQVSTAALFQSPAQRPLPPVVHGVLERNGSELVLRTQQDDGTERVLALAAKDPYGLLVDEAGSFLGETSIRGWMEPDAADPTRGLLELRAFCPGKVDSPISGRVGSYRVPLEDGSQRQVYGFWLPDSKELIVAPPDSAWESFLSKWEGAGLFLDAPVHPAQDATGRRVYLLDGAPPAEFYLLLSPHQDPSSRMPVDATGSALTWTAPATFGRELLPGRTDAQGRALAYDKVISPQNDTVPPMGEIPGNNNYPVYAEVPVDVVTDAAGAVTELRVLDVEGAPVPVSYSRRLARVEAIDMPSPAPADVGQSHRAVRVLQYGAAIPGNDYVRTRQSTSWFAQAFEAISPAVTAKALRERLEQSAQRSPVPAFEEPPPTDPGPPQTMGADTGPTPWTPPTPPVTQVSATLPPEAAPMEALRQLQPALFDGQNQLMSEYALDATPVLTPGEFLDAGFGQLRAYPLRITSNGSTYVYGRLADLGNNRFAFVSGQGALSSSWNFGGAPATSGTQEERLAALIAEPWRQGRMVYLPGPQGEGDPARNYVRNENGARVLRAFDAMSLTLTEYRFAPGADPAQDIAVGAPTGIALREVLGQPGVEAAIAASPSAMTPERFTLRVNAGQPAEEILFVQPRVLGGTTPQVLYAVERPRTYDQAGDPTYQPTPPQEMSLSGLLQTYGDAELLPAPTFGYG